MILGQTRTSFNPPVPPHAKSPHTGFYSGNFWPFSQVMHRMSAFPQYRPPMNPNAGPQMLPAVPPPITVPTPGPGVAAAVQAPSSAPAMHGFGGAGFGSTGGMKPHHHHFRANPYQVMRSGWIPGVSPNGSNIRAATRNAGSIVRRSMPFQTAPLPPLPPPPPPPVAVAPMPAATHGFGYAHAPKRRHWLSRMVSPETVAEVDQRAGAGGCETYPPRADGVKVTVCNGRVVKYEDAQGNVNTPDSGSGVEYGSGGMAGFGYHGGWGQRYGGGQQQQQYLPPGAQGQYPHHRHHHHMWDQNQQQQPDPNAVAPVPAFGRW